MTYMNTRDPRHVFRMLNFNLEISFFFISAVKKVRKNNLIVPLMLLSMFYTYTTLTHRFPELKDRSLFWYLVRVGRLDAAIFLTSTCVHVQVPLVSWSVITNQQTDMRVHREVTLAANIWNFKIIDFASINTLNYV